MKFSNISLVTPCIVKAPSFLECHNIPPLTRAAPRRGEQTPSHVLTYILPEFEDLCLSRYPLNVNSE